MPFVLMLALAASDSGPPDAGIIALCIPIVAIIFGSLTLIVKSIIKHRERMAKIGMGIDPDTEFSASQYPPAASPPGTYPAPGTYPPPGGGYPPHPNG
jgi:hypothetical protein